MYITAWGWGESCEYVSMSVCLYLSVGVAFSVPLCVPTFGNMDFQLNEGICSFFSCECSELESQFGLKL